MKKVNRYIEKLFLYMEKPKLYIEMTVGGAAEEIFYIEKLTGYMDGQLSCPFSSPGQGEKEPIHIEILFFYMKSAQRPTVSVTSALLQAPLLAG